MDIETQESLEITWKERCFEFWFVKHPLRFLWLWIITMIGMAIFISEQK